MKDPGPQPIHRKDYRPPDFWIDSVDLTFELAETSTAVRAKMKIRRNLGASTPDAALVLDGEKLTLQSVSVDGETVPASGYSTSETHLRVANVPDAFVLETVVEIDPGSNTELSGLYRSGDTFCTQCEAEGFRRITYFLDRPDVMSAYSTTIIADPAKYPILLSNGNRVSQRTREDGRQEVRWEDPFVKPAYLFALVAADLQCHRGSFTTMSGREVALEIWVEAQNIDSCEHAMRSLQRAMKWDEEVFGLEYDLDIYMIVAVSDFNMAAMENKGLNIFNAKYVLARPETATDADYENIEGVIAHEYFHNWTGNRVTCRDWFQLTLKEGLTVFRDEQFSADMTSAAVKRIQDVELLRTSQFAEDASPTAHPIRPDSYIEMNNFYTVTVYSKGAEVIRMMHTLLGPEGFRKGMDLYFERHDGQAVTCDDFRSALADASGVDLEQFGRWYEQAGTPIVEAKGHYDSDARTYTLALEQRAPANVDAAKYEPMHIPVATGLVGADGADLKLQPANADVRVEDTTAVLELRDAKQSFVFEDVDEPAGLSLLRGFSAPVKLELERSSSDLAFLMGHDSDAFSRWDAAQTLARELLLELSDDASANRTLGLEDRFVSAFGRVLADKELDPSLTALTLRLPEERLLGQYQKIVDVEGLHRARVFAIRDLGRAHETMWWDTYRRLRASTAPYQFSREAVGQRRLKNVALRYLVELGDDEAITAAATQCRTADNMTDMFSALAILADTEDDLAYRVNAEFLRRFEADPLVVHKWFAVQAMSARPDTLRRVIELTGHAKFEPKNPNCVRSLLGVFSARNQVRFHDSSGGGYALLAEKILEYDRINPQLAARLIACFTQWRRFDTARQTSMRGHLGAIVATKGLSRDVYELANKCLGD